MDIRFLGQACFELTEGDTRILIDPFLSENPKATVGPDDVDPTHIFLTHGHFDHWGDVVDIAKRTGAHCVAIAELAGELQARGHRERGGPEPRRHRRVRLRLGPPGPRVAHIDHPRAR